MYTYRPQLRWESHHRYHQWVQIQDAVRDGGVDGEMSVYEPHLLSVPFGNKGKQGKQWNRISTLTFASVTNGNKGIEIRNFLGEKEVGFSLLVLCLICFKFNEERKIRLSDFQLSCLNLRNKI